MSRRTERREERRRAKPAPPARRARRRWPWAVALVLAAGVGVLLMRGRGHGPGSADRATSELGSREMLERERQAIERKDWAEAYDWAARLARREPHNASLVLAEGTALHNVAWGVKRSDQRYTARTSLDRLTLDLQAMALMDSSARMADTPEVWSRARAWQGQLYEVLGLPIDALDIYYEVGQRVPADSKAMSRGRYVLGLLREPLPKPGAPPAPADDAPGTTP